MYNRFRFAYFGIITKTCITLYFDCMLRGICYDTDTYCSVFHRHTDDIRVVVFYRALANPSGTDVKNTFLDFPCESFSQNIIYASWRYIVQSARHYTGNDYFLALARSVSAAGNRGRSVYIVN